MPSRGSSFRFTPIAVGGIVIGGIALIFFIRQTAQSFPALPNGSFVGTISGLSTSADHPATIYVERISGARALLFVVFREGWKPQVVPIAWQSSGETTEGAEPTAALEPVTILNAGNSFTLYGRGGGTQYSGDVVGSNGVTGSWSLGPVSTASLRDSPVQLPADFNFKVWLRQKAKRDEVREKLTSVKNALTDGKDKLTKLDRLINDEHLLRERSRLRRDELAQELTKVTDERKKRVGDLKDAISDLGVLSRITKRGQSVELARRIATRENKWYALNWGAAEDVKSVEEDMAEQEQVDLQKLNAAMKRAEEIEKLQNTITQEEAKIRDLEQGVEDREPAAAPAAAPARSTAPPPKENKPWWKQWDTIL